MKKLLLIIAIISLGLASCKKEDAAQPVHDTVYVQPPVYETVMFLFQVADAGKQSYIAGTVYWNNESHGINFGYVYGGDQVVFTIPQGTTGHFIIYGQAVHGYSSYYLTVTANSNTIFSKQYANYSQGLEYDFTVN